MKHDKKIKDKVVKNKIDKLITLRDRLKKTKTAVDKKYRKNLHNDIKPDSDEE